MNYTSKGFMLPEGSEFFTKDHANFNAQKSEDLIVALEGSSSRAARFVIGTSYNNQGWAALDCNYLCDGTDDQVEINAAIAALPGSGGEIVILDGTYNIGAQIEVNKNNVIIKGSGAATVLKRMYSVGSTTNGVIKLNAVTNCKIEKLTVDGNKAVHTEISNIAIYLVGSNNNTVKDVVCNNNHRGITLSNSNNNNIVENTCNNNGDAGILLQSTSNENNITGNICKNNSNGIYVQSSNFNNINGNACNNNSARGISINNNNNNTIVGNTCYDNGLGGIHIYTSSKNIVTGNTCIRGTGIPEDYTAPQNTIELLVSTSEHNLITNNNCMGKKPLNNGGPGNTLVNNKWDASDDIKEIRESINTLGAEVDTHATDITNRLKKDGDRTSKYLGINNFFSGICFTGIGSETQIKIKTKIRLAEPLMFEIKYGGFNKAQIIYLTFAFESHVGDFSYAKAKSIGTSPPVITLAKENEYIVIHIATGSTGSYSPFYANVISRYPNQIIEPENWTAVKEAILPEATSVTVVPYVD